MVTLAALREPRRTLRMAVALWIAWAVIVWNVVFDHVIVVAGRQFIAAAGEAAQGAGPYARMDDLMQPAVTRAFWTATAAAAVLLVILVILCPLRRIR
jgi:predicted secreted protein